MISAIQSAMTGLHAFGIKMQSNANNIANSATEGYKRTRVDFSTVAADGVRANVSKTTHSGPQVQEQTANGYEMVEHSNVDLGREMVEMIVNTHSYTANLKTIQTADRMLDSVLSLKA